MVESLICTIATWVEAGRFILVVVHEQMSGSGLEVRQASLDTAPKILPATLLAL